MRRADRRAFVAGVGGVLLAAIVLCPLMATAAPASTASSCHDRPAHDHHGDGSPAFTCCATVVAAAALKAAPEADAALAPAVERETRAVPHTGWRVEHPPPRAASPPLFVRHAALLI
jgi:hypothetical protein